MECCPSGSIQAFVLGSVQTSPAHHHHTFLAALSARRARFRAQYTDGTLTFRGRSGSNSCVKSSLISHILLCVSVLVHHGADQSRDEMRDGSAARLAELYK